MKGDRRKKTARDQELRRLASHVRDQEHLETIVSMAEPKLQNGVRGLLMQHVKFATAGGIATVCEDDNA